MGVGGWGVDMKTQPSGDYKGTSEDLIASRYFKMYIWSFATWQNEKVPRYFVRFSSSVPYSIAKPNLDEQGLNDDFTFPPPLDFFFNMVKI